VAFCRMPPTVIASAFFVFLVGACPKRDRSVSCQSDDECGEKHKCLWGLCVDCAKNEDCVSGTCVKGRCIEDLDAGPSANPRDDG